MGKLLNFHYCFFVQNGLSKSTESPATLSGIKNYRAANLKHTWFRIIDASLSYPNEFCAVENAHALV